MPHTIPDAIAVRREELLCAIQNLQRMIESTEKQIEIAKAELAGYDFAIKVFLSDGEEIYAATPAEAPKRGRRTKAQMEEARRADSRVSTSTRLKHTNPAKSEIADRIAEARDYLARCGDMGAGDIYFATRLDEIMALITSGEAEVFEDQHGERRYRLRQPQPETPE